MTVKKADELFATGSFKRAAEAYQQLLQNEKEKDNPLLNMNCGRAWKEACRYKEAIQFFEQAEVGFEKLPSS
eukprot:CAMPEP_0176382112 /NCGR_PEP_ID=MMETSP0126-20121128/32415_1 /TAXON_ID=141414 ORGANISM="Strombidinopsis acuminatum, Strain SPMC142" /NCGR_SAMPLE_ID=MMETSP0126 /ASSEMBLY_ACC=CAM_ASM_000229 /LENGTH=71 /DNA_ID=CAMNT_0017746329 /DNA_START=26 /DNA_END=241 /DNA_ORIENTATION=-